MEASNPSKNRKRPHKKNFSRFRAKAKRYSKSGRFGRGTHIDDTDFNYFINILDTMKEKEGSDEKELMAKNVLEQTNNREIELASNQIVSKVLESLIGFADDIRLERYFTAFGEDLRPICSDPFASHVLQKLLEIAFLRAVGKGNEKSTEEETRQPDSSQVSSKQDKMDDEIKYNLETDFKMEHRQKCSAFVERVGKFLLNNMEDFVWDACANHIMRTAILCLAGIHVPKVAFEKGKGIDADKNRRKFFVVAPQWNEIMKEYAQRLQMWPQFSDLPYDELTSALLGVICIALYEVDKKSLKTIGIKLLNESFLKGANSKDDDKKEETKTNEEEDPVEEEEEEDKTKNTEPPPEMHNFPKVFQSQPALILLETLLGVAGPKLFEQIYAMLFVGRLDKLALEKFTNFSVQKLLNKMRKKEDFESLFEGLSPHIEKLLQAGNTGIVAALSAACLRLSKKQAAFVNAIQKALHIAGGGGGVQQEQRIKCFLTCLVKLKPYEIIAHEEQSAASNFVHLHGSLIVQHILKFNKPILLVNCILETPADKLCALFNTPNGSHIVNAFLESKYVGEKSREKLIRHMENFYVDLAITKFGSRVIDCLFVAASQEAQKLRIVKALSEKENLMTSTPFGRLLENKLMLRTYRLSPAQWKSSYQKKKEDKAKDLFKDIIN